MNHPPYTILTDVWGIGEILDAEKVTQGVLSTNWFVTGETGRYFLKRYRFDDAERIAEIHATKQHFASAGIPIILPRATNEGRTFYSDEHGYFALFPFVDARQIAYTELSTEAITSMGTMLARLHLAGRGTPVVITKSTFRTWDTEDSRIETYIKKCAAITDPTPFDQLALKGLQRKQELIAQNPASFSSLGLSSDHLIHGDFLDHNLFFDSNDHISHVFDVEKTQYAPRAYEVVRTVLLSVLHEDYSAQGIHRGRIFLDAYRAAHPLSDEEFRTALELYFLKLIRNIWIHKECYDLDNQRPQHFLPIEMERMEYLAEHRDELARKLTAGTES